MWTLNLEFDTFREDLLQLLEFETEYAGRMSRIEHIPFASALEKYTEWKYLSQPLDTPDSVVFNPEELRTPEQRRKFFDEKVVPEQHCRYEEALQEIRDSYAGFICEAHTEYYSESPELLLTLHFRNRFSPDSPFEHKPELVAGLQKLVTDFHRAHPEITRVQCASWLNNKPEFLALFPQEWFDSRTVCLPMEASTGWWGSLIDHNGRFRPERAAKFRERGGFSCPNVHCRCLVSALLEHLNNLSQ